MVSIQLGARESTLSPTGTRRGARDDEVAAARRTDVLRRREEALHVIAMSHRGHRLENDSNIGKFPSLIKDCVARAA